MCKFVAYYRVSTAKQGESGLGLEAQRSAVAAFLNGRAADKMVGEFTEVESGKRNDRPELAKAMALANLTGATLLIAKLDRLSRDAHFLLGLQKAGVAFTACDLPVANKLTVGIMALVAENEREAISRRTKDALAAAKARGKKLGGDRGNLHGQWQADAVAAVQAKADERAENLRPVFDDIRKSGVTSARGIARELSARGIRTARGGDWSARQVIDTIERLA